MKQILFDTNIILDIALRREPFFEAADQLFSLLDEGKIKGFMTATSATDIYFVSKKVCGRRKTIAFIRELIDILEVLSVTKGTIVEALNSEFKDFEDAVQFCVADMNRIDAIVTRNKPDFSLSTIRVYTPDELIKLLTKKQI